MSLASTRATYTRALRAELDELGPLLDVVRELGAEEQAVLLMLAKRLLAGQRAYGRLDLAKDPRDWRKERADELADALVYGAIAEVAATMKGEP